MTKFHGNLRFVLGSIQLFASTTADVQNSTQDALFDQKINYLSPTEQSHQAIIEIRLVL